MASDFNLGEATLGTTVDLGGLNRGIDDAEGRARGGFDRIGGVITTALGTALANVGLMIVGAIGGAISSSIDKAGEFEAGMNRFASVTGTSIADAGLSLDDFKQKFLDLGAETAFSAAQAQDAAIALVKGGISVTDVMGGATEATLNLAAAGELELATAADIVAKQLGVWADQGVTAAQVSDLLAQAANASTVDVDELANGLANAQGTAKTAGVAYEDLVQTMALIAPNFASASTAGTSLNNFLVRLQPTTVPAQEAFDALGLSVFDTTKAMQYLQSQGIDPTGMSAAEMKQQIFNLGISMGQTAEDSASFVNSMERSAFYDAEGNFVGMAAAADILQEATSELSEAEKTQALQTIFGNDAMTAAAAIAAAGTEGFEAMGVAMGNAGSASDQAAQKQQGFAFAMDSLKGSIKTLQIILGGALMPVLTDLINNIFIPGVNAVMDFANALIASNDPFQTLVDMVNTALPGFDSFVATVQGNLVPILAGLGAMVLAVVVPAFIGWATAAGTAALATITAMAPVVLPILAIGAAIGVLAAAWTNDWGGIRTTIEGFWNTTGKPIFDQLVAYLGGVISGAVTSLSTLWTGTLQPALNAVWSFIQANILPILESLANVAIALVKKEIELLAALWTNVLQPALATAWDYLQNNIMPVFNAVAGVIRDTVMGALGEFVDKMGGVQTWLGYIKSAADTVIGVFRGLANAIDAIEIPPWLQGASPPPLADWLEYIADSGGNAADMMARFGLVSAEVLEDIESLADAASRALEGVFGSQASFARAQSDAWRDLAKINDARADVEKLQQQRDEQAAKMQQLQIDQAKELADLDAEAAGLRITAAQNDDPEKRAEAERKLVELERQRTELLAGQQKERDELAAQQAQTQRDLEATEKHERDLIAIQANARAAIKTALTEAQAYQDPALQAGYFKMRSDQILALADLEKQLSEAQSDSERIRIQEEIEMEKQAQELDRKAFEERARRGNPEIERLIEMIEDMQEQAGSLRNDAAEKRAQAEKAKTNAERDRLLGEAADLEAQAEQLDGVIAYYQETLANLQAFAEPPPKPPPPASPGVTSSSMGLSMPTAYAPSGMVTAGYAANANAGTNVRFSFDERAQGWLRDLVRVEVETFGNGQAAGGMARRRLK